MWLGRTWFAVGTLYFHIASSACRKEDRREALQCVVWREACGEKLWVKACRFSNWEATHSHMLNDHIGKKLNSMGRFCGHISPGERVREREKGGNVSSYSRDHCTVLYCRGLVGKNNRLLVTFTPST